MSAALSRRRLLLGPLARDAQRSAATVDASCLAARGIYCRSCAEACTRAALGITLLAGGFARVAIDPEACNACGDCVEVCPVSAIQVPATPVNAHA